MLPSNSNRSPPRLDDLRYLRILAFAPHPKRSGSQLQSVWTANNEEPEPNADREKVTAVAIPATMKEVNGHAMFHFRFGDFRSRLHVGQYASGIGECFCFRIRRHF